MVIYISEIVKLYKDDKGTIKVYPKTIANGIYMDDDITKLNDKIEDIETSLIKMTIQKLVS